MWPFKKKPKIDFKCNICDTHNHVPITKLTREEASCGNCGSTVRMRSIIQVLTTELFGKSLPISKIFPPRPDIAGIGMSCLEPYAIRLPHRVAFRNTYYHQEPFFDVTNIRPEMEGTLDFVISTDVFEHIAPPVSTAFENVRRILKPNGVLVFSVPFTNPDQEGVPTKEHFPDLFDYQIAKKDGKFILRNTTRSGEKQVFEDLVFHGGPGSTLEMRVFSEWGILEEMRKAGFTDVTIYRGDDLEHGVKWTQIWSVSMSARAVPGAKFSVRIR